MATQTRCPHRMASSVSSAASHGGFTLMEVLIALVMTMVIAAAVLTLFDTTSGARTRLERISESAENGRYALSMLESEVKLAGYYGEWSTADADVPTSVPNPCSTTQSDWTSALPIGVQGYEAGTSVSCLSSANVSTNSDILVIRRASTCHSSMANCQIVRDGGSSSAAVPYIQISHCSSDASDYVVSTTSSDFTLKGGGTDSNDVILPCSSSTSVVAPKRQFFTRLFFVATSNDTGDGIPTLKRVDLLGSSMSNPVSLVEGVESFRVEYGIDTNDDGYADRYTRDPTVAADGSSLTAATIATNWSNVVTVRMFIVVRTTKEEKGYSRTLSFTMNSSDLQPAVTTMTFAPGASSYRRQLFTGTVRVENIGGRRES